MEKEYTIITLNERPNFKSEMAQLHHVGWVSFMKESPVTEKYWRYLLSWFSEFQYVLLNEKSEAVACGNAIPFYWDGNEDTLPSGWDKVFEKGVVDYQNKIVPNTLSALAIVIHPKYRGKGLSELMVREMKGLAIKNHIQKMVAPVRPSLKSIYPLIPMEEYIRWVNKDGDSFDPWIRTHMRTGASIIKVAEKSMEIPGSVKEWEKWTNMKFPSSGSYTIKEALTPLNVDISANKAVYVEPNVWMRHYLTYSHK